MCLFIKYIDSLWPILESHNWIFGPAQEAKHRSWSHEVSCHAFQQTSADSSSDFVIVCIIGFQLLLLLYFLQGWYGGRDLSLPTFTVSEGLKSLAFFHATTSNISVSPGSRSSAMCSTWSVRGTMDLGWTLSAYRGYLCWYVGRDGLHCEHAEPLQGPTSSSMSQTLQQFYSLSATTALPVSRTRSFLTSRSNGVYNRRTSGTCTKL